MALINLSNFKGEIPRLSKRQLPDNFGQLAVNTLLTSGDLEPWYYPKSVDAVLCNSPKTVYRMYNDSGDYWLSWPQHVDVVKTPVAGDETFRIFFSSGDFEPRTTNLATATTAPPYPAAFYVLGVTPPITAPSVSPSGGASAINETRVYTYTFVTPWGEESEPSPGSTPATGKSDATWAITGMDTAPPNSGSITSISWSGGYYSLTLNSTFGLRAKEELSISVTGLGTASFRIVDVVGNVVRISSEVITGLAATGTWARVAPHNTTNMTKRLYRLVSSGADVNYYLIQEVAVATTSFNDTAAVPIQEPIPSLTWSMPPADLNGLCLHPSGALIGFSGNEVFASEPFRGFAFPDDYRLTVDYEIVGLGVFGTTIVVCTKGQPYIITGNDPSVFTMQKLDYHWPCVAKQGISNVGVGVMYPTPSGVALIAPSGSQLVTQSIYTQREFSQLNPASFIAAAFDGGYYAIYRTGATTGGLLTIVVNPDLVVSRSTWVADSVYTDPVSTMLYVITGQTLAQWGSDVTQRLPFDWWSKDFLLPRLANYSSAKVDAQFFVSSDEEAAYEAARTALIAANQAYIDNLSADGDINSSPMNFGPLNGSRISPVADALAPNTVLFTLYGDGNQLFSVDVTDSKPFRLPAGIRYEYVSIRISGTAQVRQVFLASSIAELTEV